MKYARHTPANIPTPVVCSPDGCHLFSAQGRSLIRYELRSKETAPEIVSRVEVPGEIMALHCSDPRGPVVAVLHDNCDSADRSPVGLFRLEKETLRLLARLPASIRDIVETPAGFFTLLGPSELEPARVVRLDRRTGAVLSVRPADPDAGRLRAASGTAVLTIAGRSRRVRRVDFDEACPSPRPPGSTPDRPSGDGSRRHRPKCACCTCDKPEEAEPGGRTPPRVPPRDHCDDGDDGVEDGCRFYTAFGAIVVCIDRCRPERDPCRRTMHARIEGLSLVGGSLAVTTRNGRSLTLLNPATLATQEERATLGPGTFVLPAPAANAIVAVSPTLGQFVLIPAQPATNAALDIQLEAEVSERVFEGSDLADNPIGPLFAIKNVSVLIIPIVDPTQAYSGPQNGDAYSDALFTLLEPENSAAALDAPLRKILRYYDEQSHSQQGLDFTVFGANTPQFYSGPPIEIEEAIESYFNGSFSPGALVSTASPGESPAEVRFRGNETLRITAVSSVGEANEFGFELAFPAALLRVSLGSGLTVDIDQSGPSWTIEYEDSSGATVNLVLDPSNLPQDLTVTFGATGGTFDAELSDLTQAFQTMIEASPQAEDFAPVEVVWGRLPGEGLGRIYILFRFTSGGQVPRITNPGTDGAIAAFLGIDSGVLRFQIGAAVFDLSASQFAQDAAINEFRDYLIIVSRLAEIAATAGDVKDPVLGSVDVTVGSIGSGVVLGTRFELSNVHGQAPALVEAGSGSGADPLNLAAGFGVEGSNFAPDKHDGMIDRPAFFEMFYGRLVEAVADDLGGAPAGGWKALVDYLQGFDTVYLFPVNPPPPAHHGAWSVDHPVPTNLRAFVIKLKDPTSDPTGTAPVVKPKWGMNFQSFDPVVPSGGTITPLEADTRTLGHELGHTLGLGDQYTSTEFDPTLQYVGGLDLMGASSSEWPHFCAYHKLVLGWLGESDRIVIDPPGDGDSVTTEFILVPTEWWDGNQAQDARDAFGAAADIPVGAALICNLDGQGGLLDVIEARAPGPEFSGGMDTTSNLGRVTVMNILDYAESGRYGQVIADAQAIPANVIKSFFRYRRRLHLLVGQLQANGTLDFADAPGLPFDGIKLTVLAEASIGIGGSTVPVYRCQLDWSGGLAADVGFADNDEEWRSTDIAIDYVGSDPGNPDSGQDTWPDGEPLGTGEKIVIPSSGTEPHRVRVRVRNFGVQTARNVKVNLFLRDPGGGGDIADDEPYDTDTIPELQPEADVGPFDLHFPWHVPDNQELHVCWRAEIESFEIGTGASAQTIISDASILNNWVQQNIFESDVTYSSPPEPLVNRFSVGNDGPFIESVRLVPDGLPKGVRLTVRPRQLRVPPFSQRTFSLRFEFGEELTEDPCRQQMDVLIRCMRSVDHDEEPWGASLFRIRLRQKTKPSIQGTWRGNSLNLMGQIDPPIGVGSISIRLDFDNGEPAPWLKTSIDPGGVFDASFNTAGTDHNSVVRVAAHYLGNDVFAPSVSEPVSIRQIVPVG